MSDDDPIQPELCSEHFWVPNSNLSPFEHCIWCTTERRRND